MLLEILGRKIKDKQVTLLIRKVLGNHYVRKKGKGMPLGNLTSQFFANVYLDELDQFVKQVLRAKYYIRYVDDFIILHNSRKELERCETMIDEFLQKYLLLELHPDKCKIFPLYKGLNFLGFRLYYHFKLLRKRNLRKAFRRIELFKEAYQAELITKEEISGSMQGWYAYVKAANTYKLRMKTETYVTSFLNTD